MVSKIILWPFYGLKAEKAKIIEKSVISVNNCSLFKAFDAEMSDVILLRLYLLKIFPVFSDGIVASATDLLPAWLQYRRTEMSTSPVAAISAAREGRESGPTARKRVRCKRAAVFRMRFRHIIARAGPRQKPRAAASHKAGCGNSAFGTGRSVPVT